MADYTMLVGTRGSHDEVQVTATFTFTGPGVGQSDVLAETFTGPLRTAATEIAEHATSTMTERHLVQEQTTADALAAVLATVDRKYHDEITRRFETSRS